MSAFLSGFVRLHQSERAFDAVGGAFLVWLVLGGEWHGRRVCAWWPDAYPYPLLTTLVSLWAILLSMAVLAVVQETSVVKRGEDCDRPANGVSHDADA